MGTVSNQEWLHLLLESLTDRIELGHREGCCRPSSASEAFLSAISGRGNIFLLHRLLLPLGLLWLPFRLDRRSQTITISFACLPVLFPLAFDAEALELEGTVLDLAAAFLGAALDFALTFFLGDAFKVLGRRPRRAFAGCGPSGLSSPSLAAFFKPSCMRRRTSNHFGKDKRGILAGKKWGRWITFQLP